MLGKLSPGTARLVHRAGTEASITAWHQTLGAVNQFGWIMLNSSGGPRQFSISGGGGIPANLPRGRPAAVAIIHSFSAADPLDASTIAGRWLENGAFVYFGAMNEPYLPAFRTPRLVASLAAGEMPLGALAAGRKRIVRPALAPCVSGRSAFPFFLRSWPLSKRPDRPRKMASRRGDAPG